MLRVIIIVSQILICGSFLQSFAMQRTGLPSGDWVGTLRLAANSDRVDAHFRDENGILKGTIDLPLREQMNIELLKVEFNSPYVRFEWMDGASPVVFNGQLNEGMLSGNVKRGVAEGRLQLIRTAKVDPHVFDHYSGLYEVSRDKLISITRFPPGPVYTDFETGRFGALFPLSEDTFFSGEAFMLPAPVDVRIKFLRNVRGEVMGLLFQQSGLPQKRARKINFRREEVSFSNGDVTLSGTLVLPNTKGPYPAVVRIHGAGPGRRVNNADELHAYHGIAFLTYDKRGVGQSTGDWRKSSFEDLAGDALAGVELLKGRPDIDSGQIGVGGGSEGGWVAVIAASRSPDIAFILTVAGPAVSYIDEVMLEVESGLRLKRGLTGKDLEDALAFQRLVLDLSRTGKTLSDEGWVKLQSAAEKVKSEKWFPYVEPDPRESFWWHRAPLIANFDPVPLWEKIKIPVLAIYAELDRNAPTPKNVERLEASLKKAGNKDYTIKIFPRANHEFLEAHTGFLDESPRLSRFVPGFFGTNIKWILEHTRKKRRRL